MPIDWNGLVRDAESTLAKTLTTRVVSGLIIKYGWLAVVKTPLQFFIGLLIGQLVKYGDWVAYYLGDSWVNSAHGKSYEQAGLALENLPKTATQEEIDAAKKAKQDAFDRLFDAP